MNGDGSTRTITDRFLRWGARRPGASDATSILTVDPETEFVCATKAFRKFLGSVTAREAPSIVDLGQAVGSNITFFGEQHGCKIFVEDLFADLERHALTDSLSEVPEFLDARFTQPDASVDGILCWDLIDYLDRPAAFALARQLTRILRPGGALLGFFRTTEEPTQHYTRYTVVDESTLRQRLYAASLGRQSVYLNRDIIKMFEGLLVSDSFLLKNATREILFRKPAYLGASRTPI